MKKVFAPLIAVAMALILFVVCVCSTLSFALGDTTTAYADDTVKYPDSTSLQGKTLYFNETLDFSMVTTSFYISAIGTGSTSSATYFYGSSRLSYFYEISITPTSLSFNTANKNNEIYSNGAYLSSYGNSPRKLVFPADMSLWFIYNSDFAALSAFLVANTTETEPVSYTDLLVNYYLDDTVVHSSILSVPSDYSSDSLTSSLSGSTVSVTVNYGSYTSTVSYNYNSALDISKSRFIVNKSTNSANYYAYSYEYKSAYIAWFLDNKHMGFSDSVSVPANLNDSLITTALVGNSIIDFQITDYDGSKIKFSYSYSKDIDFLNSYYEITTSGDGFVIKYYAVSVPPPTLTPPSFDGFDSDLTEEDFFSALTKLFNLFQLTLAQLFTFGMLTTDINPAFQFFVAVLMIILTLDILKRLNIV